MLYWKVENKIEEIQIDCVLFTSLVFNSCHILNCGELKIQWSR